MTGIEVFKLLYLIHSLPKL